MVSDMEPKMKKAFLKRDGCKKCITRCFYKTVQGVPSVEIAFLCKKEIGKEFLLFGGVVVKNHALLYIS